jgi:solute carrier family 25 (adenine nucleotide translocator) protein 4/5/6/31
MGKDQIKLNPIEDFMLAGCSAGVAKTVAAPIERVKLLLQNQGESAAITKPYKGIVDVFVRVPQEQGFASFWRGNLANVVRYFPTQALNFMFKERYKKGFKKILGVDKDSGFGVKLLNNVAAGGAAGATSLMVVYPLDFARTRLAVDVGAGKDREFTGLIDTISKTAKASGVFCKGGVYNGFWISCVGIIAYRGLYFGIYDTCRSMIPDSFWLRFLLGYSVTAAASTAAYPIDTIRRRMMMTSGGANASKYTSSMQCAGLILKEEGVGAMFKGAGSNILRGMAGALVLVGFDEFKAAYIQFRYPGRAA